MVQWNHSRAPIEALQAAMGKALAEAIDKQGGKVAFAKRAGLSRATLYRLLAGENVSTEVLLRTLRALGRGDLLSELVSLPAPSPLELRPPTGKRTRRAAGERLGRAAPGSLVNRLTLGQLSREERDG